MSHELPELTEADQPYLDAITASFGGERPARETVALRIIRQYVEPTTMPSVSEFAEVFEQQFELCGRVLGKSSQFAFYMAAYINQHWEVGSLRDYAGFTEENFDSFLNLTYTHIMQAAVAAQEAERVFDLDIVLACIKTNLHAVTGQWAWYIAEAHVRPDDAILAARLGCSLPRVVEAEVGRTLMAPSPGDVYLLEEMEVPYSYYAALTPSLHISDIVRAYISGLPLEYALATVGK